MCHSNDESQYFPSQPTDSLQYADLLGNKTSGDIHYREDGKVGYFVPHEPPSDISYIELFNPDGTYIEDSISPYSTFERVAYVNRIEWIDSLLLQLEKAVSIGLFESAPDQCVIFAVYLYVIRFNLLLLQNGACKVQSPAEQVERRL